MHTHNIFDNMSNLGSLGRNISGMFCFVSFATAAFTPRILLLHDFYFSQESSISKALVLNYTEMFIKRNYTILMFFSLYHWTVCSSKVMVLKVSSDLRFRDGLNVLFSFGYLWIVERRASKRISKNQSRSVIIPHSQKP